MPLALQKLTLENFADYEKLTSCEGGGGCYCSFWHQRWSSMGDWETAQKETPLMNRDIVREKVRSHFHVGVLAYRDDELAAWISVGTLPEFFWTWRRVAQVGDEARDIAGIVCLTVAPKFRGAGLQAELLLALRDYGRERGWKILEGYPFDASAVEKHGNGVKWPGLTKGFVEAGFRREGAHWLSNPEAERSIYRLSL